MQYRLLKKFLHYPIGHVFETNSTDDLEYDVKLVGTTIERFLRPHDLVTWLALGMLEELCKHDIPSKLCSRCPPAGMKNSVLEEIYCKTGCAFRDSDGWVPEPGCPIHDVKLEDVKDERLPDVSKTIHDSTTCRCPQGCQQNNELKKIDEAIAKKIAEVPIVAGMKDHEVAHSNADTLLVNELQRIGYTKTCKAFNKLTKWYA